MNLNSQNLLINETGESTLVTTLFYVDLYLNMFIYKSMVIILDNFLSMRISDDYDILMNIRFMMSMTLVTF